MRVLSRIFWTAAVLACTTPQFEAAAPPYTTTTTVNTAFLHDDHNRHHQHYKHRKDKHQKKYQTFQQQQPHQQQHQQLKAMNDRFDMEELKHRMREEANPYSKLFAAKLKKPEQPAPPPKHVYIIQFKPNTKEQGVHTIEFPKGSGNNFILAFESKKGCDKFAETLKAQQFFDPTPQKVPVNYLESFCEALGVFFQVVPAETELLPPTKNVKTFGHNPSLKEQQKWLNYIYDMGEVELEDQGLLVLEVGGGSWE